MVEVEDREAVVENVAATVVKPFVVVGIPAFNEEKTIARVIVRAQDHADKVVVCDDGSSDLTAEIAERLGADVIKHERNMGYGAAIQSLFKRALELDADVLVTLDADGQHDAREVPDVVKPIVEDKADVVVGSRFADEQLAYTMPWYRRAGIKFLTKLANGNSRPNNVSDGQSGFRAYSRKAVENLVVFEDGMGVSAEILINAKKQGFRIREVSTSCTYDSRLKTSTRNPIRHAMDVIGSIIRIIVEERPLTTLGLPGILFLTAGISFGIWMLQVYATEHRMVTNIALASVAFTLIGFFALSTAITLYAITRLSRKMNHN